MSPPIDRSTKKLFGRFAERLLFDKDEDDTQDGLKSPCTAYREIKNDDYKTEQDLAEKYRSFVSEIMRLSLLGIGVFPFLIASIKSPLTRIRYVSLGCAAVGILILGVSIYYAMRFLFGASEGLRWYIAGLRLRDANDPCNLAQKALNRRTKIIQQCRHDKFSAALCLLVGAVFMAFSLILSLVNS